MVGGGGGFSGRGFPVYWPLKGHTFVFFSFIQGLAIKNTTGKYFIAVPLTGLSLLTCKSFIWMLSGPYSCYYLTASALTQAPWPWPPRDNMRVCDRAAASGVTGFLEAWCSSIMSGHLRVISTHLWSKTSRLWQPELQQEAPTTRLLGSRNM